MKTKAGKTRAVRTRADQRPSRLAAEGKAHGKRLCERACPAACQGVKLQEWVVHKGLKVCIVFEGRDGAGKEAPSRRSSTA